MQTHNMNFQIVFFLFFLKFWPICDFFTIIESLLVACRFNGQQRLQHGIWSKVWTLGFFLYLLSSCILFAACILIDDWNLALVGCFGLWCKDTTLDWAKSQGWDWGSTPQVVLLNFATCIWAPFPSVSGFWNVLIRHFAYPKKYAVTKTLALEKNW
jgi:hypothetical protein